MSESSEAVSPRPLASGDVVAGFSEFLGEWTAAQVIRLDPRDRVATVLDLDWSGAEPGSLADLGDIVPLRLRVANRVAEYHMRLHRWLLPRSHRVLGSIPLLTNDMAWLYTSRWQLGAALAEIRQPDRSIWTEGRAEYSADKFDPRLAGSDSTDSVRHLHVHDVRDLDCALLVKRFPRLIGLRLSGSPGRLTHAAALGQLRQLKWLDISDLFGMTAADQVDVRQLPALEELYLDGIPADYAKAMRRAWASEVANGTDLRIRGARTGEWLAENLGNPLRDWEQREHIGVARSKKAASQYKVTRRAVLATLAVAEPEQRHAQLVQAGAEFARFFNRLDAGRPFITTIEREELFDALARMTQDASGVPEDAIAEAQSTLIATVDSERDW